MDEKPELKTVRVRINVNENAPPRKKAGEVLQDLAGMAKKMIPFSDKKEKEE
jgi:hypothetical protein